MFTCIDVGPFLLNVSNTLCDNKGLFYAILFYSSVNPFLLHIHYVVWFVFLSKRCAQSANLQSLTIKHIIVSHPKRLCQKCRPHCVMQLSVSPLQPIKPVSQPTGRKKKNISGCTETYCITHKTSRKKIHTQTLSHSHTHVKTYDIFPNGANATLTSSVVISGFKSPTKTWKWSSTKENTDMVNKLFANPQ